MSSFFERCALLAACTSLAIFADNCDKFKIDLNPNQQKDITYIVHTLGNNSTFGLMKYKKSLEEAGDRVHEVSPFVFFGYVVTTDSLKADLKKLIAKRGIPFNRFVNGFNDEFKNEATKECFDQTFEQFCKTCNLDVLKLKPIFLDCYKDSQRKGGVPFAPFIEAIVD